VVKGLNFDCVYSLVNPLPTNDTYMHWQKGTGGGGSVHPNGANSMTVSGLARENPLVGAWLAISLDLNKWT